MSDTLAYARYELLRTFRNRRLYIFSFAFPVLLYYAIAGPNRHLHNFSHTGIAAVVYFMVGLAGFGAMNAVLGSGARISAERAVGWNRQLRLTPLSTRNYFRVKVHKLAEALPSYWLVQASRVGLGGHGWGAMGWFVVAAWTVVAAAAARRAYARDTQRV